MNGRTLFLFLCEFSLENLTGLRPWILFPRAKWWSVSLSIPRLDCTLTMDGFSADALLFTSKVWKFKGKSIITGKSAKAHALAFKWSKGPFSKRIAHNYYSIINNTVWHIFTEHLRSARYCALLHALIKGIKYLQSGPSEKKLANPVLVYRFIKWASTNSTGVGGGRLGWEQGSMANSE